MKKLVEFIDNIEELSPIYYHELINSYTKKLVDNYLDNRIKKELQMRNTKNNKMKIWNKYGYYLSTKEHSIYEEYEIAHIKGKKNNLYQNRKEQTIYAIHLLSKKYLTIINNFNNEINLDIKKIFSSIKTIETRDYVLNRLLKFYNTTKRNSNYDKSIIDFLDKYVVLCQKEPIPNLDKLFNTKSEVISEEYLIEQIDMYIRYCNAKEIFFDKNINLVKYTATKCYENNDLFDDILQDGMIGLIKAIDTYDIRNGYQFSTYAFTVIKRYIILNYYKYNYGLSLSIDLEYKKRKTTIAQKELTNKLKRKPTITELATYLKISENTLRQNLMFYHQTKCDSLDRVIDYKIESYALEEITPDKRIKFEEQIIYEQLKEPIFKIIDEILTEEEKDILFKRNGYNTESEKEMTLNEISKQKNLTIESIRKIEEKAIMKLRRIPRFMRYNPFIN